MNSYKDTQYVLIYDQFPSKSDFYGASVVVAINKKTGKVVVQKNRYNGLATILSPLFKIIDGLVSKDKI